MPVANQSVDISATPQPMFSQQGCSLVAPAPISASAARAMIVGPASRTARTRNAGAAGAQAPPYSSDTSCGASAAVSVAMGPPP